jgi:hypothetical protein
MRTRLALLLALALVVMGLLVPVAAQANDEAMDYAIPAWIGTALGGGEVFPGPDLTMKIEIEPGVWVSFFEAIGYPRDPLVGDNINLVTGWGTFGLGQALTAPKKARLMLDVYYDATDPADADEPVLTIPLDEAAEYWSDPAIVPPPDLQPFNPRIGAKEWVVWWVVNHMFDQPGWYAVHFYFDWGQPTNDLTAIWGEEDWLDKFAGHLHYRPGGGADGDGVIDSYFHFYVGQ